MAVGSLAGKKKKAGFGYTQKLQTKTRHLPTRVEFGNALLVADHHRLVNSSPKEVVNIRADT
jgi:hypothetical protein